MTRLFRFTVVVVVGVAGCGDPDVAACAGHCDKRASCGQDLDVDQCHEACEDSVVGGDDACVAASRALSSCQLQLSCDDYVENAGCDDEAAAVADACGA